MGKIEKVRVLRNDRREGRLNFKEVRYKFRCAALSVRFHQIFKRNILLYILYWKRNLQFINLLVEETKKVFVQVKTVIVIVSILLCAQLPIVGFYSESFLQELCLIFNLSFLLLH